jgi:hypothetical protein
MPGVKDFIQQHPVLSTAIVAVVVGFSSGFAWGLVRPKGTATRKPG